MKHIFIFGVPHYMDKFRRCITDEAEIISYKHDDVFRGSLPDDIDAVWLTVDDVYDVEAARQLRRIYPQTPLVVVGNSRIAALKAIELGAAYYLDYDADASEISEVVKTVLKNKI